MPCAGLLNQQSWRWAHNKTLALNTGMSTFSATLPKQTNVNNATTASMGSFSGALTKLTSYLLPANMSNFSGSLTKLISYLLSAGMSSFAGALTKLTSYLLPGGMSTFSGALTKLTGRTLNASMSSFAGALTRLVSFLFTGSMSTFGGVLSTSKAHLMTIVASMASFSGSLTKLTSRTILAGMGSFAGALTKMTARLLLASMNAFAANLGILPPFSSTVVGHLFPVPYVPTPQQPGGPGTPVTLPTETVGEQVTGFLHPGCNHSPNHWEVMRTTYAGIAYVMMKCPLCGYVQRVMLASDYDNSPDPFNWY